MTKAIKETTNSAPTSNIPSSLVRITPTCTINVKSIMSLAAMHREDPLHARVQEGVMVEMMGGTCYFVFMLVPWTDKSDHSLALQITEDFHGWLQNPQGFFNGEAHVERMSAQSVLDRVFYMVN